MHIPFLVPTALTASLIASLLYWAGFGAALMLSTGCVLIGYVITLASIARSAAGWFRRAVAISHSIPLGYLFAASLLNVDLTRRTADLFLEMVSTYPVVAGTTAVAVWLLETGIRHSRLADRLDVQ